MYVKYTVENLISWQRNAWRGEWESFRTVMSKGSWGKGQLGSETTAPVSEGRGMFCGLKQPGLYSGSISPTPRLGQVSQLPRASFSLFVTWCESQYLHFMRPLGRGMTQVTQGKHLACKGSPEGWLLKGGWWTGRAGQGWCKGIMMSAHSVRDELWLLALLEAVRVQDRCLCLWGWLEWQSIFRGAIHSVPRDIFPKLESKS